MRFDPWKPAPLAYRWLLRLLAGLYAGLDACRRKLYDWGIFKTHRLAVPVIVVGNVVVGGTGKTPVVMELVKRLQRMGYRPGVISRGYGRTRRRGHPGRRDEQLVLAHSTSQEVGDEPLLIARRCGVPVVVGAKRVEAARLLLKAYPDCNVLVSDDALQHLALARDVEVVLFDERGVGNQQLLPAGPLREVWPREPHCRAHLVLYQVPRSLSKDGLLSDGTSMPLADIAAHQPLYALAGIAKPERFFEMLRMQLATLGLSIQSTHAYPDHADFSMPEVAKLLSSQPQALWLCTEKDAVKLWPLYPEHAKRIVATPLLIQLDASFLSVWDATVESLLSSSPTPHSLNANS